MCRFKHSASTTSAVAPFLRSLHQAYGERGWTDGLGQPSTFTTSEIAASTVTDRDGVVVGQDGVAQARPGVKRLKTRPQQRGKE